MFSFRKEVNSLKDDTHEEEKNKSCEKGELNGDISENLEYINSFLAQISLTLGEITKQQTIHNALYLLDQEYNHADSVMDVEEIIKKRKALLSSIFIDYQVKEQEKNKND